MTRPIDIQIADKARQLFSDENCFATYAVACARDCRSCKPLSSDAAHRCARGALVKAAFDIVGNRRQAFLGELPTRALQHATDTRC